MRSAELLVRRKVVERALQLMMTRDLVEREIGEAGIRYKAGENAAPFFALIQAPYIKALEDRARWTVRQFASLSDEEFRSLTQQFFDRWVEEFQVSERSLGSEL